MFPINWNDVFRKKDGTLGTMEDLGGGSDLPEYSSADAGKLLGVDEEGLLEWKEAPAGTKIYYKDFTSVPWPETIQVAKFADNAASAGGFYIAAPHASGGGGYPINVNGYTPISAVAIDEWTGYQYGVLLEHTVHNNTYYISIAIGHRAIDTNGLKVRVFYIKNENVEVMPS